MNPETETPAPEPTPAQKLDDIYNGLRSVSPAMDRLADALTENLSATRSLIESQARDRDDVANQISTDAIRDRVLGMEDSARRAYVADLAKEAGLPVAEAASIITQDLPGRLTRSVTAAHKTVEQERQLQLAHDAVLLDLAQRGQVRLTDSPSVISPSQDYINTLESLTRSRDNTMAEAARALRAVMTAGATDYGAAAVPENLSGEINRLMEMEQIVAGLIPQAQVSASGKFTKQLTHAQSYHQPEITADSGLMGVGTTTAVSLGTGQYEVRTQQVNLVTSFQLLEDGVADTINVIRESAAFAHAADGDDAILNGSSKADLDDLDNAGSTTAKLWGYTDSSSVSAPQVKTGNTDHRFLVNGLRKYALALTASGGVLNFGAARAVAAIENKLRMMRVKGGKHVTSPARCAYVVPISVAVVLMGSKSFQSLEYRDGAYQRPLPGQIGTFDMFPVVVSDRIPAYYNASGVFDNVTEAYTVCYLFNHRNWQIGNVRPVTVGEFNNPLANARGLAVSRRWGMVHRQADTLTDVIVGTQVYNAAA